LSIATIALAVAFILTPISPIIMMARVSGSIAYPLGLE
jgi:hypothetical protein